MKFDVMTNHKHSYHTLQHYNHERTNILWEFNYTKDIMKCQLYTLPYSPLTDNAAACSTIQSNINITSILIYTQVSVVLRKFSGNQMIIPISRQCRQ